MILFFLIKTDDSLLMMIIQHQLYTYIIIIIVLYTPGVSGSNKLPSPLPIWASFVIDPHGCCMALSSLSAVLVHDVLGLLHPLLPPGASAELLLLLTEGLFVGHVLSVHSHRTFLMMVPLSSCLHLHNSSSFVIFLARKF